MKRLFKAFLNVKGINMGDFDCVMGGPDLIQLSLLIAELSAGSGADIPKIEGVPEMPWLAITLLFKPYLSLFESIFKK